MTQDQKVTKAINEIVYPETEDTIYCGTAEVDLEMLLIALNKKGNWIFDFEIDGKGFCYFRLTPNSKFISWQLNTPYALQSEQTKKAIKNIFLTT